MAKDKGVIANITSKIKSIGEPKRVQSVEYGATGTEIFGGILNEEFNPDLQFPDSITVYEKMRSTDATISAILDSVKSPLLSAKWFIKAGGEDEKAAEIEEFVERALFEEVDFQCFLAELLGYLDFGFYPFEKVFKVMPEDDSRHPNMIFWKGLAPRIPSSIYKWEIAGKPWVNGHPAGITQQLPGNTDDITKKSNITSSQPSIPWEKLIIFHHKMEGNNFEGRSLLRAAYKHWFYKDLLYKISGISAERFGAGIPYAKMKKGAGTAAENKIDEFLKNMKANEQAFIRLTSDVEEWGIKTPDGGESKSSLITELIKHHDKKIYDTILAGFLNLTTGEGGSNALSKDQSSFFLRSLQAIADYIIGVINVHIKELVDMNFQNVENYPRLMVSEIGSISMDEAINSISGAVEKGLIELTEADQVAIRKILKLPELPMKDEQDEELEQIEGELDILEVELEELDDEEEETPEEEGQEKEEEPTEKEMAEYLLSFMPEEDANVAGKAVYEFGVKGKPLDEETKRKISEALRKRGGDTVKSEFDKDKKLQGQMSTKARIKAKIQSLRDTLKSYKSKSRGMPRKQKIAFNKQMRNTIEFIKRLKSSLIQGRINVNRQIKERKSEIRKERKERKIQERINKAIAKEEKRRAGVDERIANLQRKRGEAKSAEARRKIDERIAKAKESLNKEFSESEENYLLRSNTQLSLEEDYVDMILANDKKKALNPKPREIAFMQNITEYEQFLEEQYGRIETLVVKFEKIYQDQIQKIYKSAKTERIDGVVSIKYDKKLIKEGEAVVDKITAKLEEKLLDSPFQENLFKKTKLFAQKALKNNDKLLEEFEIDEGQFNSFVAGYISNIKGVLFNEPRRFKEAIVQNFASEASLSLAVEEAGKLKFNKNVLKLSTVTHARATYKGIIYKNAQNEGFTFYKVVVPKNKIKNVLERPDGMTAAVLFFIGTAAMINKKINERTDGKNPDAVKGLGLHHGSFEYYYPIASDELDEEEQIASEQKRRFKEKLQK